MSEEEYFLGVRLPPVPDSHPGTLSTIGYADPAAAARLTRLMEHPATILMDVRYRPQSRFRPAYNRRALAEAYGARYIHCKALGNVNYNRPDQPIRLLDPDQVVPDISRMLHCGWSVVLLCACKEYDRCHRKVVYDLIKYDQALRDQLEEVKIRLLDQGCQTVGDALRRDEDGFILLVDLALQRSHSWSEQVLAMRDALHARR